MGPCVDIADLTNEMNIMGMNGGYGEETKINRWKTAKTVKDLAIPMTRNEFLDDKLAMDPICAASK